MQWEVPLFVGVAYVVTDVCRALDIYCKRKLFDEYDTVIASGKPEDHPQESAIRKSIYESILSTNSIGPISTATKWRLMQHLDF